MENRRNASGFRRNGKKKYILKLKSRCFKERNV
jgi:hypothetical protein